MEPHELVENYRRGPEMLQQSLEGLSDEQLDATPVPGTWSVRQVVCHLTDAEIVYADRIKRVLVEDNPTVFDWSPDLADGAEFCAGRRQAPALELIRSLREHVYEILADIDVEAWQRTAVHSTDGPITLESLLERITGHIPHHVEFIRQKRAAMGMDNSE